MVKRIVSIALSNEVVESLDQTTKALGMSRSEYIEMMIKKGFHFSDEVQNSVSKISKLQKQVKDNFSLNGEDS
jgi:metal-responsive CopG/Arc/MetJ family transcriptional regulator